jgi:chaperonin GroES
MKIRPLGDRVVVQRVEKEEKKGAIVIPDTAKEKPLEGKVIAVGPGARNEEGVQVAPDVKAGDRVLFGKYAGMDVKIDDEEYLVLREGDILGIV